MAGPLGVSHLLVFSRSSTGNTNLRLALLPRGPTLHFRIEKYSLCKDVQKALRHPKGGEKEYLSPPLLVMNNFMSPNVENANKSGVPKHLETLATTIFQSLFPPISPQSTSLSSIRRVLLLNRELPSSEGIISGNEEHHYVLKVRHYAIATKPTGLSRGIRLMSAAERASTEWNGKKDVPNLGNLSDVADFIVNPSAAGNGFTSGSESEVETDAEIEVPGTYRERIHKKRRNTVQEGDMKNQLRTTPMHKRAVRLVELGPRMTLRMIKVEEEVCGGKVLWHDYMHKSMGEVKSMETLWEARKREKAERKRVQEDNIERKRRPKTLGRLDVGGPEDDLAAGDIGTESEGWNGSGSESKG
ncbi:MAG: hypothetical protein L6R35_004602 [Caloplaca aegaea]|nr:MAG: hypothetical protein L6R35_004602 [Caloplaca aegaea]